MMITTSEMRGGATPSIDGRREVTGESMRDLRCTAAVVVAMLVLLGPMASAQEPAAPRIDPAGIDGHLLLCGDGKVSRDALEQFLTLTGAAGRVLIVTAPGSRDDRHFTRQLQDEAEKRKIRVSEFRVDPEKPASEEELRLVFAGVTGIWLAPAPVTEVDKALAGPFLGRACQAVLKRGGVLAAAGPPVPALGQARGGDKGELVRALRWLPGMALEVVPEDAKSRLSAHMKRYAGLVGCVIEPGAALLAH